MDIKVSFEEYINSNIKVICPVNELLEKKKFKLFYLRYLGIALMAQAFNIKVSFESFIEALNLLWNTGVLNKTSKDFYIEYEQVLSYNMQILFEQARQEHYDISVLYQEMLDSSINYSTLIIENNGAQKKNTGAYYTSNLFAQTVTQKAVDDYIEKKINIKHFSYSKHSNEIIIQVMQLLLSTKVVDLSCGGGEFLLAYCEYLRVYVSADKKFISRIITNIFGIDIDPIALLITQIRLYSLTDNFTPNNFYVGNPLLEKVDKYDFNQMVNSAALGRPYMKHLGIDVNSVFEEKKIDIILGNPPWEKIRFEDKYYFQAVNSEIFIQSKKDKRMKMIELLKDEKNDLFCDYIKAKDDYDYAKKQIKKNKRFKYSACGELNTYNLFVELATGLISEFGQIALIVKSGIITTSANKAIFNYLVDNCWIDSIYSFINTKKIFLIDSRERFCVLYLNKTKKHSFDLHVGLTKIEQLDNSVSIKINSELLSIINPETHMLPNVSTQEEMNFILRMHEQFRVFGKVFPEAHFGRIVHLTLHANRIYKTPAKNRIGIYEGKFIEQYDGRYATFNGVREEEKYLNKANAYKLNKLGQDEIPFSRFYIDKEFWNQLSKNFMEQYSLLWRSLTSSTNKRTMIATILPKMPTCQSIQLLQMPQIEDLLLILALFNSMTFDYIVRLKLSNIDLTQTIIRQIPVPEREAYEQILMGFEENKTAKQLIIERIKIIFSNESRLSDIFGYSYPTNKEKRNRAISEIDDIIRRLYNINDNLYDIIQRSFE